MHSDPLVTVAVFTVRSDAVVAGARLDAAGISSLVRADDEGGLNPGFFARYGIRLEVRAEDVDAARAVLDEASL